VPTILILPVLIYGEARKAGANMDFTEDLVTKYAKKIFGFAFAKTNDIHNAEDLAQDIIMALCADHTMADKSIGNMDAYIYRVCCYSWSKYLRRNKPGWEALKNTGDMDCIESHENMEEALVQKELYDKLQREIMFLSKTRRDIMLLFYYENQRGDVISRILGIPASTVRWHLSQAKHDLRERIQMPIQQTIYKPIRLATGRNGWGQQEDPCGLHTDVLMQNMCWICRGKGLTIEEIARTLCVPAVYLEDKMERLLYMDYMKIVNKNKYQTSFFIPDVHYQLTDRKFHLEKTLPMAIQFYRTTTEAVTRIKAAVSGLADCDNEYLMWQMMTLLIFRTIQEIDSSIIQTKGLHHTAPKRKNGTKIWANASVRMCDILENTANLSDDLYEFCRHGGGNKIKLLGNGKVHALQFDLGFMGGHRSLEAIELSQLRRVHEIMINHELPNRYEKEWISQLIRKGFVSNRNGHLKLLVPYFTATDMQAINQILQECANETLNRKEMEQTFYEYISVMSTQLPSYVDENERNHLLTGYSPYITILWLLYKKGYLREPAAEEKAHLCTVVWEDTCLS
jgi:RNA polymerase sigma factor (sigma-70 family)